MRNDRLQGLREVVRDIEGSSIVFARIPLDGVAVESLLSTRGVSSVVLSSEHRELKARYPGRVGYFLDGGAGVELPIVLSREAIYLGEWSGFGARAALTSLMAGIRGIRYTSDLRPPQRHLMARVVAQKLVSKMRGRIVRSRQEPTFSQEEARYSLLFRRLKKEVGTVVRTHAAHRPSGVVLVNWALGPGGAERQISATLVGLVQHGHDNVHFLHHGPMKPPDDFFLPKLADAGISHSRVLPLEARLSKLAEDRPLAACLRPFGDLGAEIYLYAREFLERRPEVVHAWLDGMNVIAGLAAVLVGVPRIVLSCRSLAPRHFAHLHEPYMRPGYRFLARFPNVMFLNNSEAGAADYQRWLGIEAMNFRVVRNAFDTDLLPSAEAIEDCRKDYRRRLGIPDDGLVVGVVMRISDEKQPLLWLEVAARVRATLRNVHFLVVGDGPMRQTMEARALDILRGSVHFMGHQKQVMAAMAAMDLFLLTSRVEGLPNVLIEAQAIGVPVVTLDVGGAREAISAPLTGRLVGSSAPDLVADAVVASLQDQRWREMAAHIGPMFVRERFSSERMILETIDAYGIATPQ